MKTNKKMPPSPRFSNVSVNYCLRHPGSQTLKKKNASVLALPLNIMLVACNKSPHDMVDFVQPILKSCVLKLINGRGPE